MRFRSFAAAVLVLVALLALAGAAQAISTPTLRAKLAREMRHAGPYSGIYVRDLETGRTLYTSKADVARIPASVQKLYTTSAALLRFGPDATLPTTLSGSGALDAGGVWRGDLYLHGGGDPTFDRTDLEALAASVAGNGILRVAGSILGDESRLDALRGSYDTGGAYDRDIGGVLGALTLARGFSKDLSPAGHAAGQLAKLLRAQGIRVDGKSGVAPTPAGTTELGAVQSPPIRELISLTNVPSDNFLAEMLVKDLGAQFGAGGTTTAGVAVVRAQLATFGVHPRIVDGSGLSRADRTTPRQVVRLLEIMHRQAVAATFEGSLAVAGRTGTIAKRMRRTPAQDSCRAKTGTLIGVSALAGLCTSASGHQIAFAMLMNRIGTTRAHGVQDRIAAALARYDGAAR